MKKEEEKEYIEVEVIKEDKTEYFSNKAFKYGTQYGQEKIKDEINDLKNGLY